MAAAAAEEEEEEATRWKGSYVWPRNKEGRDRQTGERRGGLVHKKVTTNMRTITGGRERGKGGVR